MRNQGLFISTYPTVIGFDISGLVLKIGDNVPTGNANDGPGLFFQPGITRVAAYAASFWRSCNPNYGAFQQRCLVPWQHAVPLPDEQMSWNYAATFPVAVEVALNAWDTLGIPRMGATVDPASNLHASTVPDISGGKGGKKDKQEEALLIWGASSSVGTMGVQSGRLLKDDENSSIAAVYATAGLANMKYVSLLGADRVFDYRDPQVVDKIASAAREDGLVIRHCFLAVGQLALCQAVLKAFLGASEGGEKKAKIASAPIVPPDAKSVDGVEVVFLQPSANERERLEEFRYCMGTWLRENLAKWVIRPSPEPTVVAKGLGAINAGLDMLLQGVSCTKLVVEVEE
jgi:NADPH:quinone reductase-like Zn-dependent oxidoreductase